MNWFRGFDHESRGDGKIVGSSLRESLSSLGIELRKGNQNGPGRWIIRGKQSNKPDTVLKPQPGQYGTYGVFFADNQEGLVIPSTGYLYVADANRYDWLVSGSSEWKRELVNIAEQKRLNLTKIGGGIEAESILYHSFCVYQPIHGYATIPNEINSNELDFVLKKDGNVYSLVN
ncbi:hypothetical protein KBD69_04805 [Candidatus Woesebacteria bacterium]|nr:hypothetical protein [Candidatus Woesebacteria bacterium]